MQSFRPGNAVPVKRSGRKRLRSARPLAQWICSPSRNKLTTVLYNTSAQVDFADQIKGLDEVGQVAALVRY